MRILNENFFNKSCSRIRGTDYIVFALRLRFYRALLNAINSIFRIIGPLWFLRNFLSDTVGELKNVNMCAGRIGYGNAFKICGFNFNITLSFVHGPLFSRWNSWWIPVVEGELNLLGCYSARHMGKETRSNGAFRAVVRLYFPWISARHYGAISPMKGAPEHKGSYATKQLRAPFVLGFSFS